MSTPVQQHAQGEVPETVQPSAPPPSGPGPGEHNTFPLDADMGRRFGGLERLYGVEGAARIRAAHVAVIGVGGVGSWAVEALARSGVGRLTLIDLDNVAESNVNRQIHALSTTVGQAKVEAMRDRIALIHPGCEVRCIEEFVEPGIGPPSCPRAWMPVIDACDQVHAKTAMAAWALRLAKGHHRFISVGAAGGQAPGPTRWTSTICPGPRTTPCWRNCATACASSTVPRARGAASASPACSAAKPWPLHTPRARWEVGADGTLKLPRLWLGGVGHRHVRPVCRRLGARPARGIWFGPQSGAII